ncbi:MAG TPA: peptidoglycan DD-metalloendopeptidase family protein [Puia sp.]|nr:peptidoglycan DD-metalloendopeptidase family protein [Puia sp.]
MRYTVLVVALCCTFQGFAQLFPAANNPRGYFRDPLDVPIGLAANFGELRPNHYHMGLDIRTQHRENLPVFAAADGYVARVSVEPGGFGQAIYINHPNGYTTVYGHLNRFFPALAAYVREQQYKRESWQVNLQLPSSLFPVKKGDFIANSGNTGGSQGPHLHFEIRRTAGDVNQNPLLFGLPVPDNTPPTLQRLAWYDRNQGIYEQKPRILPTHREPGAAAPHGASGTAASWSLSPSLLIVPTTRISFALSAFDTQSGSTNPNGIYEAALYVDEQPVIGFQMNNISYENTRNINAHIDYRTRETGGPFLQQLFFLSGYPAPSIYSWPTGRRGDGVVRLEDGLVHEIRILVRDTYGNASNLRFRVQYREAADDAGTPAPPVEGKKFYAGMVDGIETPDYAFFLGEKSLYDSVTIGAATVGYPGAGLSLPGAVSAAQAIGAPWIPLLDPVLVRLRPDHPGMDSLGNPGAPAESTDRIVMVCFNGDSKDVVRPEWKDGWASARFREFGNFQLVDDRQPPVISFPGLTDGADLRQATRLVVVVKDNLGAWKGFRAELDPPADGPGGQWLCFTNDKGLTYIYPFDDKCPAGSHVLRVAVQDVAGNVATKELRFIR